MLTELQASIEHFEIPLEDSQSALKQEIDRHIRKYKSRTDLLLVYYIGHGGVHEVIEPDGSYRYDTIFCESKVSSALGSSKENLLIFL